MFNVLAEEKKVAKRAERAKLKKEELQAKLSLSNDEVKGRAWADVSDDDEEEEGNQVNAELAHLESSDEESRVDPESPARSQGSPVRSPVMPGVAAGGYPAAVPKIEPAPQLSKKAKKAQKKQELDDLDSVLAEFGVGIDSKPKSEKAEEQAQPGEGKRSKKKKKAAAETIEEEGGEVNGAPEPELASAEPSDAGAADMAGMDEEAKAAALEALKKKAAAKKGAKAKSGTAAAAAEAKKRAANAAKPKKDKNAFDR